MATITNISPIGDLIIPALNNLVVKAGESAEVSEEAAASLLEQTNNWTSAKGAKVVVAPVDPTPPTSPADSIPAASN